MRTTIETTVMAAVRLTGVFPTTRIRNTAGGRTCAVAADIDRDEARRVDPPQHKDEANPTNTVLVEGDSNPVQTDRNRVDEQVKATLAAARSAGYKR